MIPRINLLTHFLKTATTQARAQTTITATISPAMVQRFKNAVEANEKLRDENKVLRVEKEDLRVKIYELKRELEEAHRQLWDREINNK
jgi:CRISPR/Cas system-associated endonuclease/helicase Cas3